MPSQQLYVWSLTWNCKDGWDETQFQEDHVKVSDMMKKLCSKWVFQLERGGQTGRLHYQGYMSVQKKITEGSLANLLHTELEGANVKPCSNEGKMALKTYAMKSDTKVAGPWSDKVSTQEEEEKKLPDRQNTQFDREKFFRDLLDPTRIRAFQRELNNMCDPEREDDRHIIWVFDHIGNSGKTRWARYRKYYHGSHFLTYGKTADVCNVICQKPDARCYIFNFPRAKPSENTLGDIINVMEQLKDGECSSYKYKGCDKSMNPPHVVVLANYWPTYNEAKKYATLQRWKFFEINHPKYGDWRLHPRDITEHVSADNE